MTDPHCHRRLHNMSFHTDELDAQARAGVSTRSAGIRDFMPEQHRRAD